MSNFATADVLVLLIVELIELNGVVVIVERNVQSLGWL
jgi:hypothetical protein